MMTLGRKILILVFIFYSRSALAHKECSTSDLTITECLQNEVCVEKSETDDIGYCDCRNGYKRNKDFICIQNLENKNGQQPAHSSFTDGSNDPNNNNLATAVLVPIFIISIVIITVYISHKFKLINWLYTKMTERKRRYDEVIIGQDLEEEDDPPLR